MSSPFGRRGRNARSVRFDLLKIMMKKTLGFLNEEREFVGGANSLSLYLRHDQDRRTPLLACLSWV